MKNCFEAFHFFWFVKEVWDFSENLFPKYLIVYLLGFGHVCNSALLMLVIYSIIELLKLRSRILTQNASKQSNTF